MMDIERKWTWIGRIVGLVVIAIALVVMSVSSEAATSPSQSLVPSLEAPVPLSAEEVKAAEAKFRATFTNFTFEEIRSSEIPGIVEIYAGPRIIYYAPSSEILILGEFYAANGISLTETKIGQFAAERAGSIDRASALVVGEGTTEVLAFVDPDCRYCREADRWLRENVRSKVREHIFFMPMNGRPKAAARAMRALCASEADRPEALRRVYETAPGDADVSAPCDGVEARLATHAQIAKQVGVYATPFFLVNGQVIAGFDSDRLNSVLSAAKPAKE